MLRPILLIEIQKSNNRTSKPPQSRSLISKMARLIAEKRLERQARIAHPPPSLTVTPTNETNSGGPDSPQVANYFSVHLSTCLHK